MLRWALSARLRSGFGDWRGERISAVFIMYFTEQPMSAYPEDEARKNGGLNVLTFSNRHFDSVAGSALYQDRLEEYKLVDEVGFDGIMLNEHHNTPFCMQPQIVVWSSILAAVTKHVKIVTMGIPLPLWDNPLQAAEAFAMVDMISGGRLVAGMVRGGGTEQFAMNVNPAYNRARFEEAHDLIIKAWTKPGPFRWEGDHYQYRVVNPWAVPLQKPHPPIWLAGTSSLETIEWAARHRYPFIGLGTDVPAQRRGMNAYRRVAAEGGYEVAPSLFGQSVLCHVQDTEERAMRNAREFLWMQGLSGLAHPVASTPSGYLWEAPNSSAALARRQTIVERMNKRVGARGVRAGGGGSDGDDVGATVQARTENLTWAIGTPDQVIAVLRKRLKASGGGIFTVHGADGRISHEDNMRHIELFGRQVIPALREIADELDLRSPFDVDNPISVATTPPEDLVPYEFVPDE